MFENVDPIMNKLIGFVILSLKSPIDQLLTIRATSLCSFVGRSQQHWYDPWINEVPTDFSKSNQWVFVISIPFFGQDPITIRFQAEIVCFFPIQLNLNLPIMPWCVNDLVLVWGMKRKHTGGTRSHRDRLCSYYSGPFY